MSGNILLRQLGRVEYVPTWHAMQEFTARRTANSADEIWLLEHPPVYTLGQAGKPEHLLRATDIPLVHIDRGGQITYHGPGQIVAYLLIDLKRRGYGVRELVTRMEQTIIDLLATHNISAQRLTNAPGVYVDNAKIAALGLRIKHGCSYHGLALNVDMDLQPFRNINPCGYQGMTVTQTRDMGVTAPMPQLTLSLSQHLIQHLTR
ncbi:octanoyltransferase [Sulfuriferula sp. AH1]|uniref:lipoyl(octanoyl) transferase LipB n=1 Tax=Sulfuriferula sp. AH1 TaxID=1985873 RepID=UPI000B3B2183|nr:lipoyl(octanoyl) transferase LipB [Sulfuriferula sp. AH1]ARU32412.1 octanoyltransferase [Sulfuriferula sp. AH1]